MDLHDFFYKGSIIFKGVLNPPALLSHTLKSGCVDNFLSFATEFVT